MARLLQPPSDYLLEGLPIDCGWCRRRMEPAPSVDGSRSYACGPGCPRPPVAAVPVEQDLLIRAMVRAYVALYQVGRTPHEEADTATPWGAVGQLNASAAERRRWNQCDLSDRRALLRTAFVQVLIDEAGQIHPVWRHEAQDPAPEQTAAGSPT